jgi:hypothetical protein
MDQNQQELANKLVQTLNKALKSGQYIKNPRGRPRKGKIFEYAVKPSTIKKKT